MQFRLSRRGLFARAVALAGAGFCGSLLSALAARAEARLLPDLPEVRAGFSGRSLLQLEIIDGRFEIPEGVEVGPQHQVQWSPDPDSRLGGAGMLDGVAGNFTGNRNRNARWLFFPWPRLLPGTSNPHFSTLMGRPQADTPADHPGNWQVDIDRRPVAVTTVFRKTSPAGTLQTAPEVRLNGRRHLVSLRLEAPVPVGAEVIVRVPGAGVVSIRRMANSPSPAVHVCQAGYAAAGPKKGYVGLWLGVDRQGQEATTNNALADETRWTLRNLDSGEAAATGVLELAKAQAEAHQDGINYNRCDIHVADFSQVAEHGRYQLEVDRFGASEPFAIAPDPYAEVLRLAARWYYHQRSGCAIEEPFGEGRARPRNGHPEDGLEVIQTDVRLGRTSEGFRQEPYAPVHLALQPDTGARNARAWGGWHDAGDWDRRVQHMDAVHVLASIVEMFPTSRRLNLNIPESGCSFADPAVRARKDDDDLGDGSTVLPDLIHEALWGASVWRRTQGPRGEIIGGVEYSLDGIMGSVSWNPVQRAYAYGPEEWAAYRFVIGAAKLGHVIRTVCGDAVLGAALVAEAQAAWDWAEQDLAANAGLLVPEEERAIGNQRVQAAAVLYRAGGAQSARRVFEADNPFLPRAEDEAPRPDRPHSAWECADYVLAGREGREVDPEIVAEISQWLGWQAGENGRLGRDYGLHGTDLYPWGGAWYRFGPASNWRAHRAALALLVNGGDTRPLRDLAIEGMWFGLGCNPANLSFMQGIGTRQFLDPTITDLAALPLVAGLTSFGVAAGPLREHEEDRIRDALYPPASSAWPEYARIFESRTVIVCAEFGIETNAIGWLFAAALVNECLNGSRLMD